MCQRQNQPQDAVQDLRVKPGRLLGTDDTILCAGHNDSGIVNYNSGVSSLA
jgi:hypothetical protein